MDSVLRVPGKVSRKDSFPLDLLRSSLSPGTSGGTRSQARMAWCDSVKWSRGGGGALALTGHGHQMALARPLPARLPQPLTPSHTRHPPARGQRESGAAGSRGGSGLHLGGEVGRRRG